jgi:hypothetical protein
MNRILWKMSRFSIRNVIILRLRIFDTTAETWPFIASIGRMSSGMYGRTYLIYLSRNNYIDFQMIPTNRHRSSRKCNFSLKLSSSEKYSCVIQKTVRMRKHSLTFFFICGSRKEIMNVSEISFPFLRPGLTSIGYHTDTYHIDEEGKK